MDKIKNRIDLRLLTETLFIQTETYDDEEMLTFIKNELSQINVTVEEDGYGNIYVTKGNTKDFPCLVAHTDTVHDIISDFRVMRNEDTIFAFDGVKRKQTGIGGDDKVGVYILLQALRDIPAMKAVFYRNEEDGCKGSIYSIVNHKSWYDDCNFVIQPDRRDFNDLIVNSSGIDITSDEFLFSVKDEIKKYEYKDVYGVATDVDKLVLHKIGISCTNISCGYVSPHTNNEIVSIAGVNKAYNFIFDVISKVGHTKFVYNPKPKVHKGLPRNNKFFSNYLPKSKEAEQLKLFGPLEAEMLSNYGTEVSFENFKVIGETKNKNKLYQYIGIKAIPFDTEVTCSTCNGIRTLFYLPYEGRIFCIKCRDFAANEERIDVFKYLEVDDSDITFVFSVYADAWLDKKESTWDEELKCWVPDNIPF